MVFFVVQIMAVADFPTSLVIITEMCTRFEMDGNTLYALMLFFFSFKKVWRARFIVDKGNMIDRPL